MSKQKSDTINIYLNDMSNNSSMGRSAISRSNFGSFTNGESRQQSVTSIEYYNDDLFDQFEDQVVVDAIKWNSYKEGITIPHYLYKHRLTLFPSQPVILSEGHNQESPSACIRLISICSETLPSVPLVSLTSNPCLPAMHHTWEYRAKAASLEKPTLTLFILTHYTPTYV